MTSLTTTDKRALEAEFRLARYNVLAAIAESQEVGLSEKFCKLKPDCKSVAVEVEARKSELVLTYLLAANSGVLLNTLNTDCCNFCASDVAKADRGSAGAPDCCDRVTALEDCIFERVNRVRITTKFPINSPIPVGTVINIEYGPTAVQSGPPLVISVTKTSANTFSPAPDDNGFYTIPGDGYFYQLQSDNPDVRSVYQRETICKDKFMSIYDAGNGVASAQNADGSVGACLVTCPPTGTSGDAVPTPSADGGIEWLVPSKETTSLNISQNGTTSISVNDSDYPFPQNACVVSCPPSGTPDDAVPTKVGNDVVWAVPPANTECKEVSVPVGVDEVDISGISIPVADRCQATSIIPNGEPNIAVAGFSSDKNTVYLQGNTLTANYKVRISGS